MFSQKKAVCAVVMLIGACLGFAGASAGNIPLALVGMTIACGAAVAADKEQSMGIVLGVLFLPLFFLPVYLYGVLGLLILAFLLLVGRFLVQGFRIAGGAGLLASLAILFGLGR